MFVCENKNVRSQLLDEERMRLVSAFVCWVSTWESFHQMLLVG